MKKNIAVIAGGDSSEIIISMRSSAQIIEFINTNAYEAYLIIIKGKEWYAQLDDGKKVKVNLNDFSIFIEHHKISFDFAFIMIHGTPGENGRLQGYLEMMRIPYSTGDVLCTALTANKYVCKNYLRAFGIHTPECSLIHKSKNYSTSEIIDHVGLPCFVKPNNGGSSFGTSKVKKAEEMDEAIEKAFKEDPEVIIESFVNGIELSCGLLKTNREELVFPVTEIVSRNEFFDFEAKYTVGMADEITPARIPDELHKSCQLLGSEIYDLVNCRGLVRVDFIVENDRIYFLELNTVPGMSKESIVPKQIRETGLKEKDIIQKIIQDGLKKA